VNENVSGALRDTSAYKDNTIYLTSILMLEEGGVSSKIISFYIVRSVHRR
jgi:hypothetical protein